MLLAMWLIIGMWYIKDFVQSVESKPLCWEWMKKDGIVFVLTVVVGNMESWDGFCLYLAGKSEGIRSVSLLKDIYHENE